VSFTLRDYQSEAVTRSVAFLKGSGESGGLVVLPTGAGKSLVIAGVVHALDAPCLIFQPSREILEQNANKLLSYGYEPSVFSASLNTKEIGQITLATIGSVKNVPDLFKQFPYVVVDEAHLVNASQGMYANFLEALGKARVLGLTATPYRLHSDNYGGSQLKFLTRTRPRVFSEVVSYAQVGDLITKGYLCRPEYQIVSGFNAQELAMNATGADYDDASVKRYYKRSGFADRLRRVVVRLLEVGRKSVLVFTRFVDEAEELAKAVPGAAVVTATTKPKERAAIVAAFRSGEIPALANVGVLGLGFDFPALSTVVLARPTLSLNVYYQQVGRVLRPHPGKTPWVVDCVDQVRQFGRVENLWLQPGGSTGGLWEMVSRENGAEKVLTNTYFNAKFKPRQFKPLQSWKKW
jgi:DNA repair protein RadD